MSRVITSKNKAAQAMKESLLQWLCVKHATDQIVTRPILKQAALEFIEYYNVEGYKSGESWLTQFLKRYKFSTTLTECCGPEFDDFKDWIEIMRPLLSEYQYEDQFFLDELVMYTDFKPRDRQCERDIDTTGSSVDFDDDGLSSSANTLPPPAMNIVSIIMVVNATGTEKIPPIVSGRYKIETPCKNCTYQSDTYSRIDDGVLAGWLRAFNKLIAESNRRIVLVLNRSYINAVKFAELTHIQPVYLPNKFPSHLRPLRRDVCHFIKMYYRSNYVQGLCQEPTKDCWEPEEIINCLVDGWNSIPPELIVVNFQRTKFRNDDVYLNINCPLWQSLKIGVSFERFVTFDDCLCETKAANYNPGLLENLVNVDQELRRSFSRDESVSKSNFVEDSMSSQDFDSLKRPSDDSVDENSCEPMDYSKVTRNFPLNKEDISQQNTQPSAIHVDKEKQQEITGWKSAGSDKSVINLASDRSNYSQVEEMNCGRNSPAITSTPINSKRYPINPSYDFAHSYGYHEHFLNPLYSNPSNVLVNLDQKYDRSDSDYERLRQMAYPCSPIPSTSKQGLEESYALQRLYSGGAENFYNDKIHQLTPTVIRSPRVDVFIDKVNETGAGDGNDNSKRPYPNEDTSIHNPTVTGIENYDYIEQPNKKIKYETHWSDCYQQQPAFGPNYNNSFDHPVNLQTVAIQPTDATVNVEMEKRSIFTLTDNTQGQ